MEILLITMIIESRHQENRSNGAQSLKDILYGLKDTPVMVHGIHFFLKKIVARTDVAGSREHTAIVKWGCKVADDVLSAISSNGAADGVNV